ncbi:Uma2 family endonuclease [Aquipuribacter nitratireducens]|uniref:Uma2 family endonuclease n=1 Tax=Aquipuribacter nitratireducens TaxID=650104 RepID=A0ABW0GPP5_9MICO
MAAVTVMPREGHWTVDDLDRLPDDGLQYELADGVLLVTPAPVPGHQRLVGDLFVLLRQAEVPGTEVFVAPLDYRPSRVRSLQPDLLVVRSEDVGPANVQRPLLLAVEVLLPSTRSKDLLLKRGLYEDSGVASYWVLDPEEPSLLVLDLVDGRYVETARVTGDDEVRLERPFPVTIRPAALGRR